MLLRRLSLAAAVAAASAVGSAASQEATSDDEAAAEQLAYGEYLASDCVSCHRIDGGKRASTLAGDPADEIAARIRSFRVEKRDGAILNFVIETLTDDEIDAIALYFASLPAPQ